jgi:hypothetical protein
MWDDLLAACALMLVIEGLLPFLNPKGMRGVWISMAAMSDRSLRVAGLISMFCGVLFLYWVR